MTNVLEHRRDYGNDPELTDFDLSAQIAALWRQRWWLFAVALLGLAAAGVYAVRAPRVYDASAKLLVSASKLGTNANVSSATFRALVENQSVAAEVIRNLNLATVPGVNPSTFIGDHVTVSVVRDSNILIVESHMPTPDLAARVANAMADGAVNLTKRLNTADLQESDQLVRSEMTKAQMRLTDAQNALRARREAARVELLNNDIESLMVQRTELASLLVQIPDERARLETAERELASQPRVRAERRSTDPVPAFDPAPPSVQPSGTIQTGTAAAPMTPPTTGVPTAPAGTSRAPSGTVTPGTVPPTTPLGTAPPRTPGAGVASPDVQTPPLRIRPEATDPYVNPVYENLVQEVATRRARLAGLEKRRSELMDVLKVNSESPAALQRLYREQTELDRLQVEYDAVKKAYTDIVATYEETKLQVTGRTAGVEMLDRAVPPLRPSSPRPLRLMAAGFAGGFGLAGIVVLLMAGRERRNSR